MNSELADLKISQDDFANIVYSVEQKISLQEENRRDALENNNKTVKEASEASLMLFREFYGLLITLQHTAKIPKTYSEIVILLNNAVGNVVAALENKENEYSISEPEQELLDELRAADNRKYFIDGVCENIIQNIPSLNNRFVSRFDKKSSVKNVDNGQSGRFFP